jgi:hypothetical protein
MLRRAITQESSSDEDEYYCAEGEDELSADELLEVKKKELSISSLVDRGNASVQHTQQEEERRFDPRDGSGPFTRAEFVAFYGSQFYWDAAPPRAKLHEPLASVAAFIPPSPEIPAKIAAAGGSKAFPITDRKTIVLNLSLSLGMLVANDGKVMQVMEGGQAASLGLLPGCVLFASTGDGIRDDIRFLTLSELKQAVAKAKAASKSTLTLQSLKLSPPTDAEVQAVIKAASSRNVPTAGKRAPPATGATSHKSTKTVTVPELAKKPLSEPSREAPSKGLHSEQSCAAASGKAGEVKSAVQTLQLTVKPHAMAPPSLKNEPQRLPVGDITESSAHDRSSLLVAAAERRKPPTLDSHPAGDSKQTTLASSTTAAGSEKLIPQFKVSFSKASAQHNSISKVVPVPTSGNARAASKDSTMPAAPARDKKSKIKSKEIPLLGENVSRQSRLEQVTKSKAPVRSVKLDIGDKTKRKVVGEPSPNHSLSQSKAPASAALPSEKASSAATHELGTAAMTTTLEVAKKDQVFPQAQAEVSAPDALPSAVTCSTTLQAAENQPAVILTIDAVTEVSTALNPLSVRSQSSDSDSTASTPTSFESRTCKECGKLLKTPEGLANHSLFTCPGKMIQNSQQRGAQFGRDRQNDSTGKKRNFHRQSSEESVESEAADSSNTSSVKTKKQKQSLLKSNVSSDAQDSRDQFVASRFTLVDSNEYDKRGHGNRVARKVPASGSSKVSSSRAHASLQAKALAESARPGIACARCSWCGTSGGMVLSNDFLANDALSAQGKELLYFCTAGFGCTGSFRKFTFLFSSSKSCNNKISLSHSLLLSRLSRPL